MRHLVHRPHALGALLLAALASSCGDSLEPGNPQRGLGIALSQCTFCHRVENRGGMIAPPMDTSLGLVANLVRDYEKRAADLKLAHPKAYAAEEAAILAVLAEKDLRARQQLWLEHYLRDTKFDNPMTKMGNVLLDEQQRADVIAWLMSKSAPR